MLSLSLCQDLMHKFGDATNIYWPSKILCIYFYDTRLRCRRSLLWPVGAVAASVVSWHAIFAGRTFGSPRVDGYRCRVPHQAFASCTY